MVKMELTQYIREDLVGNFTKYNHGGWVQFTYWLSKNSLINKKSLERIIKYWVATGVVCKEYEFTPIRALLEVYSHKYVNVKWDMIEYIHWLYKMDLLHAKNCIQFYKNGYTWEVKHNA